MMNILWKGFVGTNHSWSMVAQNLSRQFIKLGNKVDMVSTNGTTHIPNDLLPFITTNELPEYDITISYTAMKNFPIYLNKGKLKLGIWCYEWRSNDGSDILPIGWAKYHKACDYILAPSNYAKDVFLDAKIPSDKIKVVPHGIDKIQYSGSSTINLPTKKRFKILANIAQNHLRKNIPQLLEAYGKAFTKNDDVVLVLKGKEKKITQPFEVSITDCISKFKRQFTHAADIVLFDRFLDDISALYRSCDVFFSASHCECFLMPALEAVASGIRVIAPKHGGQLDFLNNENAYLVDGKIVKANPRSLYWHNSNKAVWFQPNMDCMVEALRHEYNNPRKLDKERQEVLDRYDWMIIANSIMEIKKNNQQKQRFENERTK